MTKVPKALHDIKADLLDGREAAHTPRQLMGWFGFYRRGVEASTTVRAGLGEMGLGTDPDFESAFFDDPHMAFYLLHRPKTNAVPETPSKQPDQKPVKKTETSAFEPSFLVSRMQATTRKPFFVEPDTSLNRVNMLMMEENISYLPVFVGGRTLFHVKNLKGVVSRRFIGECFSVGKSGTKAADFMEEATIVDASCTVFEAIRKIRKKGCLLYQAEQVIGGILTRSDLLEHFEKLQTPYFLVGEVEGFLRRILDRAFEGELQGAANPKRNVTIKSAADLTFGEYIFFLEKRKHWARLGLSGIEHKDFIERLKEVSVIRNEIMHFNTDLAEDQPTLRKTVNFIDTLKLMNVVD